jgi:predicted Rossmann-fold nucleotide-binding protein
MPGGPGTLEEISEAVSAGRLGLHHKPCIFFNINGYYDAAEEFFEQMTRCGFASADELRHVYFVRTLNELAGILEKHYEI